MVDEESPVTLTPQQAAGATKRARNREKLINSADALMRRDRPDEPVTVGDICDDAGVSSATFYANYTSRNELCIHAVTSLIVAPLEATDTTDGRTFKDAATALLRLSVDREALLRAALVGRLERPAADLSFGLEYVAVGDGGHELRLRADADFLGRTTWQLFRRDTHLPRDTVPSVLAQLHIRVGITAQLLEVVSSGRRDLARPLVDDLARELDWEPPARKEAKPTNGVPVRLDNPET